MTESWPAPGSCAKARLRRHDRHRPARGGDQPHARPRPRRQLQPSRQRDAGRAGAEALPRGQRPGVRAGRPRPRSRQPGGPHPRQRHRPVAGAARAYGRGAGRRTGLAARPVLRRRRRRRVPVGPWHRGHEERDGDARGGDGGARARGLPAKRRSGLHRRGRRGGRNPPGGDGLAGGRTPRPGHRLRHQRGRRRSHGAVGRARVRADLRRREVLPGRAGDRAGRGRPRLHPQRRRERRAAAGDADRSAGRLPAGAAAAAGDAGDAGGADRPVRRGRPGRSAGAGGRRCTAAFPR